MRYLIRIEMKVTSGKLHYYESDNFYIAGENQRYKILSIGATTAKTVNVFFKVGNEFSTKDKDMKYSRGSKNGGFWYDNNDRFENYYLHLNRNPPKWYGIVASPEYTIIKIRAVNV